MPFHSFITKNNTMQSNSSISTYFLGIHLLNLHHHHTFVNPLQPPHLRQSRVITAPPSILCNHHTSVKPVPPLHFRPSFATTKGLHRLIIFVASERQSTKRKERKHKVEGTEARVWFFSLETKLIWYHEF